MAHEERDEIKVLTPEEKIQIHIAKVARIQAELEAAIEDLAIKRVAVGLIPPKPAPAIVPLTPERWREIEDLEQKINGLRMEITGA